MNRPCNCLPDIAQQLFVTLLCWMDLVTSLPAMLGDGTDSDLKGGIPKELIIFLIGKEVVII